MTPYGFMIPGQIVFGRGTATQAAGLVLTRGARVVLVHGASAARAEWLRADLEGQGGQVTMVACPAEPDVPGLEAAVALLRPMRPDVIVALGSKSVATRDELRRALATRKAGDLVTLRVERGGTYRFLIVETK